MGVLKDYSDWEMLSWFELQQLNVGLEIVYPCLVTSLFNFFKDP